MTTTKKKTATTKKTTKTTVKKTGTVKVTPAVKVATTLAPVVKKVVKKRRRIMYLRNEKYMPIGCVAISLNKDRTQVRYQLSVVNPHDEFEKSLARQIALGRLIEMPVRLNGFSGQQNNQQITFAVMNHILKSKTTPTRAKKAARNWLTFNDLLP
jgi:hypothetical protein